MSKRGSEINYYKGHSRSRGSRGDDSDRPRDVGRGGSRRKRSRSRSRSRERRRRYSSPSSCSSSSSSDRETASLSKQHIQTDQPDTNVREMSISPHEDVDETPSPPPPPRISKISIDFNKPTSAPKPIQMSLVAPAGKSNPLTKPSIKPGSVFGDGSDEEPEEMPAEARMRMRNIGRDTPTSVGPNSFGKTKQGFCNPRGIVLKNLKEEADPPRPSLKATIYKL